MNETTHNSPPRRAILMASLLLTGAMMISGQAEADNWQRIDGTGLDHVYANTNADLSGYNRIMVDPLSVWYVEHAKLDEDQVQANLAGLRSDFNQTIKAAFERDGYEIVDTPGP